MATEIVMDRTGDTRHNFDAKKADAILKAEERFRELTGAGFTAAVRTASGEAVVKRTFYPAGGETPCFSRLRARSTSRTFGQYCGKPGVLWPLCRESCATGEVCATGCSGRPIALNP